MAKDWNRPPFNDLTSDRVIEEMIEKYWLGPKSVELNHNYYIQNMICLIQDSHYKLKLPITHPAFTIEEECDDYIDENTNPSGGNWEGEYRRFRLTTNTGNNQTVSISVLGQFYHPEDPEYHRFRNLNQHSYLLVAVGASDNVHNSLQLDLDDVDKKSYVIQNQNSITILHDGTLTCGHSIKRERVIEFMRSYGSHLLRNDKVVLGTLPCDRYITWQDAREFILNCIEYGLLRDEFRETI